MSDLRGRRALITGASSGIGEDMARLLAARGCNLVISARRKDKLEALASELRTAHSVDVLVVSADLAKAGQAQHLWESRGESDIDILINNAGFGAYQDFEHSEWERSGELLMLNIQSLAQLSHLFVAHAIGHGRPAHLLNVASLMGQIATPGFAAYNGSKAFVSLFSLSLTLELKRSNIKVSCLLPGGTTTEFVEVAGVTTSRLARMGMMSSERCATIGLRGMFRGKAVIVPGVLNKAIHTGSQLLPSQLVGRISRWVVGKPPLPGRGPSAALQSGDK